MALWYREECSGIQGKVAGGTLEVVGWGLSELFGAVLTKTRHPATPVRSFIPGLRKKSPCFKKCKNLAQNIEICQLTLSFNLFANFTEFDVLCFKCTVFQYCHSNH